MGAYQTIALTITGVAIAPKIYDGTDLATVTGWGALQSILPGDDVSMVTTGITATFDNANAGTGKAVALSGNITLAGADKDSYCFRWKFHLRRQPDQSGLYR